MIAAWLVSRAERNRGFFIVMLFLGLAGFFYSLSGFLGFSIDRPLAPSWIAVAVANVIAGLFMAEISVPGASGAVGGDSQQHGLGDRASVPGGRDRTAIERTLKSA